MAWVAGRYAARSLRRNIRRSGLAIAGIAIGCILALVMEGINRGREEMFARAGTYSGAGHLRVVGPGWRESREPTLRLANPAQALAAARAHAAVIAVTPRTRSQALLALGTRVTGVELVVSEVSESSAWGAAMAGLLGLGLCSSLDELAALPRQIRAYRPQMDAAKVKQLHDGWLAAVKRVL